MGNYWTDAENIVLNSRIKVPYAWQAGETASHFLIQLRDEKKIWGKKCPKCQKVHVPAKKSCGYCFVETTDWVPVSDQGTVITYTIVSRDTPVQPVKAPFAYAVILLDGADTGLVHIMPLDDPEKIKTGMRVQAVWADDRKGSLLDIRHFVPIES
jgi:uncharacterized OB-fold protein